MEVSERMMRIRRGFMVVLVVMGLFESPWAVLAVPAATLLAFAFAAVGMAATTFMRSWQDFDLIQLVVLPLFLFSGTFYPITAYPPALRLPNRIWWRFAQALGWFNARVILTVFFALVLIPAGLLMRLAGRNPLRPSTTGTNWTPYPARRADPRHYEHMF